VKVLGLIVGILSLGANEPTGNQWNLRSVATADWETAAFSPTPQLHPTLLGPLCYYSCYYFRSIWPVPGEL
jgi:hypothetical protein